MKVTESAAHPYHSAKSVNNPHFRALETAPQRAPAQEAATTNAVDGSADPAIIADTPSVDGTNLPPVPETAANTASPAQLGPNAKAIEHLQYNLQRKPDNSGLQHALEMVQANQLRHRIDTQA